MKKNYFFAALLLLNLVSTISFAQIDLTKGLVAYYPMNGDAKSTVGTGIDLTNTNATLGADRFGHANSAYYFNGNGTLITNFSTTSFTGASVAAWIKTNYTSSHELIMQMCGIPVYVSRFDPGTMTVAFDANTSNNASTDETMDMVATNGWVFVSASNDGSTTRLYINGKIQATYSETLSVSSSKLSIGGSVNQDNTFGFYGAIDETRIYNRQLSDDEMMALYEDCTVNLSDGLVAHYAMNGDAKSSVGTGLDLTVTGATLTTDRFGKANSAYAFDGSSDLSVNFNSTGYTGMSVSAWIKTSLTSRDEVVFQVNGNVGYINRFSLGHFMAAMDANSSNNATTDESTTNVATGQWVFVSASNDGTTTRVYVNGKLEATYGEILNTNNTVLEIGAGVGGTTTEFVGSIDEVSVYNRVLCDNEMAALYTNTVTGVDNAQKEMEQNLSIYPNPSHGIFVLDMKALPLNTSIQVSDITGKLVVAGTWEQGKRMLDLSQERAGVYLLTVKTSDAIMVKRLEIQ